MLTPVEIRTQAERKYPEFLRALVRGENLFPWCVRFGKPSTTSDFAQLKSETEALVAGNFGYTLDFEEKNTRHWGVQSLPRQVRFDTKEQFVRALRKEREVQQFKANVAATRTVIPQVNGWLESHVKWVVEYCDDWQGILQVCQFFLQNPRPGLYVRELPIPVHTKFIPEHREVLTSLLLEVLPEEAKDRGGKTFEEKFGLKPLEATIRFRALDQSLIAELNLTSDRMGLPLDRFRALPIQDHCIVIITENLMNLECLPAVPGGLGIWGQGNAAELLTKVGWLNRCRVFYWGDIDEHGMHILSRLRSTYPEMHSLLMDAKTLADLRHLCGSGEKTGVTPANLTPDERSAFEEVARLNLRLEQEKIPMQYSLQAIQAIPTITMETGVRELRA